MVNLKQLIAAIVFCELAGIVGAVFTIPSIPTWYASLAKPFFNPPSWIFSPVWTLLYAMMGISLYFVWQKRIRGGNGLVLFGTQLSLNVLWSLLFFGLHSPILALVCIIALWTSIALTIRSFAKIDSKAAWLLAPYLLWVTFAAILNYAIFALN
ncbi:MAG: TspO/MBR family protein [Candidatus Micrarchaeota archaeon]